MSDDRLYAVFEPQPGGWMLSCPVCECLYLQGMGGYPRPGSPITCAFVGECGHRFGMVFTTHKGMMDISIERLADVSAEAEL